MSADRQNAVNCAPCERDEDCARHPGVNLDCSPEVVGGAATYESARAYTLRESGRKRLPRAVSCYLMRRIAAVNARLAGDIAAATAHEDECERYYRLMPRAWRW